MPTVICKNFACANNTKIGVFLGKCDLDEIEILKDGKCDMLEKLCHNGVDYKDDGSTGLSAYQRNPSLK